MARPTLTLIDGSSYVFRAYHALPHLSTSKGVPTNAVYGFTLMLLKALREGASSHLAIAFDKDSRVFRQAIDPAYKAHRPPTPDDLVPQFPLIRQVVEALNVPVLEYAGWEADDVIATLARSAVADGFKVLVVTGDKDLMQLVGEHVELYDSMTERRTRSEDVPERLGVPAEKAVEYFSLVGDAVDNVPGVPKIGPKTAARLIAHFGTVERLLERVDEVAQTGIRGAKGLVGVIRSHADQIRRAKRLVTLVSDLDLPLRPADLARRPMDEPAVRRLFGELEFSRLLRELPVSPPRPRTGQEVELVLTPAQLDALVARLEGCDRFAVRALTDGPRPRVDPVVGLAFALGGGEVAYLPMGHRYLGAPRQLDDRTVSRALQKVLEDPARPKVGHDLKGEFLALRQLGLSPAGLLWDAELMSWLLNASRRDHALADLARERLLTELPGDVRLVGGKRRPASDCPVEEAAASLGAAVEAALRLCELLASELAGQGLEPLARDLEMPLLPILAGMERVGIRVDRAALAAIDAEVVGLIERSRRRIWELAGREFNVGSNPQLAQVLFQDLGLPVLRRGKTGPSADQEVLEKLARHHPLPREVIEYRGLAKLKSTYLDALPGLIERDGRIHTCFHQAVAATGRLSSRDPNLQNVPVRTDLGRRVREAFVAEEGWRLVSADYSQIELRVLAHVSRDPALLASFARDEDVHTRTAAEVFGVEPAAVTGEMRQAAKAINFGIAYGQSAYGLAQRLDLPGAEAQGIIDRYFARYAGVRLWLDETVRRARETGEVSTLFGRRRFVPEIQSGAPAARQGAERVAVNMPIQGTAADLIKRAMIEVDRRIRAGGLRSRLLLQLHDELLLEAPEEEVDEARRLLVEAMEGAGNLEVRLAVEVGVGRTWAEAH